jgi:hypothetical protein
VVVGGIYSPNHQTNRWGWAAVDGCTGQSGAPLDTVRCASHVTQSLGFDRWSSDSLGHRTVRWCTEQSLFTVRCAFWRCSDSMRIVRCVSRPLESTVALATVAPLGTPDSPVSHRTVWWIIAESRLEKPEGEEFELIHPGTPDTVQWHTGQSGASDQGPLRFLLILSFEP